MTTERRVLGAGICLVLIYALQFLAARVSLAGNITPSGLTILRFYAAGALFIPYLCLAKTRQDIVRLGLVKIVTLSVLAGFPYLLVINTGISLTSAGYVASVGPGSIVLFSFLLPLFLLAGKADSVSVVSTMLITTGILLFIYNTFLVKGLSPAGTALFVLQGLMFSLYGVLIKRWQVGAIPGTAAVSLASCLPAFIAHASTRTGFAAAPVMELLFQAFTQGILAGAAAILLYTYIVRQIGPQRASLLMPSVPIITTVAGHLLLNEPLGIVQIAGLTFMALGMSIPGLTAIHRQHLRSNKGPPMAE
ncbi:DMT family transporter [Rhizobiaceae bacterium BDR2-2]|uniref:DMT family transporter n=1 Tax=Ectorhizobium quercum TaxID=2965071 RepID=A0AAE3SUP5_9HYPH|nr:DMT family transporter [Ectorhizobium quercum]MCX8997460.1 DMT family transporter [Ectorhizobium quercum]